VSTFGAKRMRLCPSVAHSGWDWDGIAIVPSARELAARFDSGQPEIAEWSRLLRVQVAELDEVIELANAEVRRLHGSSSAFDSAIRRFEGVTRWSAAARSSRN